MLPGRVGAKYVGNGTVTFDVVVMPLLSELSQLPQQAAASPSNSETLLLGSPRKQQSIDSAVVAYAPHTGPAYNNVCISKRDAIISLAIPV